MKIDAKIEQQYLVDSMSNEVYLQRNNNPYYVMTAKHGYYAYNMDYTDVLITKDCIKEYFEPVENLKNITYITSRKIFYEYISLYNLKGTDTYIFISLDLSKESLWDEAHDEQVYREDYFKVHKIFYKLDDEQLNKSLDFYNKNFIFGTDKQTTINIVLKTMSGFKFKEFDISPLSVDVDKHYNNSFKPVHNSIVENLGKSEKGIIMLHGVPGSGKTNYIKYLTGLVPRKKFVFIPPSMVGHLSDPSFIENLIDNKNSVLVLEDCEIYLKDRKLNSGNNNFVSSLLNISDGILSDVMSIQVICTFNNDLKDIDPALLRDGRLIAEYKFEGLDRDKAEVLAKEAGVNLDDINVDNGTYTLANIYNAKKKTLKTVKKEQKIGFK